MGVEGKGWEVLCDGCVVREEMRIGGETGVGGETGDRRRDREWEERRGWEVLERGDRGGV